MTPEFRSARRATWWVAALFLAAAGPVTFLSSADYASAGDEAHFHHPTVRTFADQLPRPDLTDYRSATTPLYHLGLAVVSRLTGDRLWILRAVNLAVGLLCVLTVQRWLARGRDPAMAALGTLVLAYSPFVFGPATRLMTDNASLLLVLLALDALDRRRGHAPSHASATLTATAAVGVRQTNLWLAMVAGALLGVDRARGHRVRAAHLLPILAPTAMVLLFVVLWGGLVPPSSVDMAPGADRGWLGLQAVIHAVALAGAYAVFFPSALSGGGEPREGHWKLPLAAGACALLVLLLVGYAPPQRVSPGPLDMIASALPAVLGRPVVMLVAFPLGAWVLTRMLRRAFSRGEWTLPLAYLCFLAPVLVVPTFFQRHVGPFTLFFLLSQALPTRWSRSKECLGPAVLLIVLFSLSIARYALGVAP